MLKRYMHSRERHFAMIDDDRVVHPFDWGTEYITAHANEDDPRKLFREYSKNTVANSEEFFFSPEITDFSLDGDDLTWTSGLETPSPETNTVYARHFPIDQNKRAAVVVLPHWKAKTCT